MEVGTVTTNGVACYSQALMIGYGNDSRKDDVAGFSVASRVRELTGRPPLDPDSGGQDDLGASPHVICVHQITPELVKLLAGA